MWYLTLTHGRCLGTPSDCGTGVGGSPRGARGGVGGDAWHVVQASRDEIAL